MIRNGESLTFLVRVDASNTQFIKASSSELNLLLEGITDQNFHSFLLDIQFYGEINFTIIPAIKSNGVNWFKNFKNVTGAYNKETSLLVNN